MSRRQRRDNSTSTVLIILAVVGGVGLMVVLACGGFAFFMAREVSSGFEEAMKEMEAFEPEIEAESFVELLGEGNIDEAYNSTSQNFRRTQTREQFQAFVNRYPLLRNHEMVEGESVKPAPGPNQATVTVTVTGQKPGQAPLKGTVRLVREGEDWKVDSFTVP